jgi:hypothetical protein
MKLISVITIGQCNILYKFHFQSSLTELFRPYVLFFKIFFWLDLIYRNSRSRGFNLNFETKKFSSTTSIYIELLEI